MGDMTDFELESVETMESLRDSYVSGDMDINEAYENGFINEMGTEQYGMQDAWDRSSIPTEDNINSELNSIENTFYNDNNCQDTKGKLNEQAIRNLKKEHPTCKVCGNKMDERIGRFGAFFFCGNHCKGQKTISNKHWQSIRKTL